MKRYLLYICITKITTLVASSGVNLNEYKNARRSDAYHAIYNENNEVAKAILIENPELRTGAIDDSGITAFELAANTNNKDLILFLQSLGVNNSQPRSLVPIKLIPDLQLFYNKRGIKTEVGISPAIMLLAQKYEQEREKQLESIKALRPQYYPKYKKYFASKSQEIIFPPIRSKGTNYGLLDLLAIDNGAAQATYPLEQLPLSDLKKLYAECYQQTQTFDDYNDANCPICYEEYDNKKRIMLCNNNHQVCLKCFNHPSIFEKCPLCRGQIPFDKLVHCQTCQKKESNLRLLHCKPCQLSTILCDNCRLLPCCQSIACGPQDKESHIATQRHAKEYTRNVEEMFEQRTKKCHEETFSAEMKFSTQIYEETEQLKEKIASMKQRFAMLQNKIKADDQDIEQNCFGYERSRRIRRLNKDIEESEELMHEHNACVDRLHELPTLYLEKKFQLGVDLQQKLTQLAAELQSAKEHIRLLTE